MSGHPHQWYGGDTFAQHGDDLALLNIFHRLQIIQPSFLDIGAHHPIELSNTALLYQRGSRGINVEANPFLIENFKAMRPEDKNIWAAVVGVKTDDEVTLNRLHETCGLNSLLPIEGHGDLFDSVKVPAYTADGIVDEWAGGCWPDLLSIDAEGMDLEILRSIDYDTRGPKVICAEAVSQTGDVSEELKDLMLENGFITHSWCGSNILFVRIELRDLVR